MIINFIYLFIYVATRAELEILDDLVHSFDYKNDDDCCKKTICRRCTLPL